MDSWGGMTSSSRCGVGSSGWMRGLAALCALLIALAWPAIAAAGEDHARVVLDVSGSMKGNDPDRLALLSTLLLHDLMMLEGDDTFQVIPFDTAASWQWGVKGPPSTTGPVIDAASGSPTHFNRSAFRAEMETLTYSGDHTYFYPGLQAALTSLMSAGTPGVDADRAIILITDGLPAQGTRDEEAALILSDLVPKIRAAGIDLHVIAVGPVAGDNARFFQQFIEPASGEALGLVLVDEDGAGLPDRMMDLFKWSFGYSETSARALGGGSFASDLDSGGKEPVHVVAFQPGGLSAPTLESRDPSGKPVAPSANRDLEGSLTVSRASYHLHSFPWPGESGEYRFVSSAPGVVIFRSPEFQVDVVGLPSGVIAERPFKVEVLVSAPGGAGAVSDADVQLRTLAGALTPRDDADDEGRWVGSLQEGSVWSSPTSQVDTPRGRKHVFLVTFDPEGPEPYPGHLEIVARRTTGMSRRVEGRDLDRVLVHPHLSIAQVLASDGLKTYADLGLDERLERGDRSCVEVIWQPRGPGGQPLDTPKLPGEPPHNVRVMLGEPKFEGASTPKGVTPRDVLGPDARVTLDGEPLMFAADAAKTTKELPSEGGWTWYRGQRMSPQALLEPHELCFTAGTTKLTQDLVVSLVVQWGASPYNQPGVIDDFAVHLKLAETQLLDRYRTALRLLLLALLALPAAWLLRDRPELAPDMRFAVSHGATGGIMKVEEFGEPPLRRRLLGRTLRHPVYALNEGELGQVEPVDGELYRLHPAERVQVAGLEPDAEGAVLLNAGQTYDVSLDGERYRLRLVYDRGAT